MNAPQLSENAKKIASIVFITFALAIGSSVFALAIVFNGHLLAPRSPPLAKDKKRDVNNIMGKNMPATYLTLLFVFGCLFFSIWTLVHKSPKSADVALGFSVPVFICSLATGLVSWWVYERVENVQNAPSPSPFGPVKEFKKDPKDLRMALLILGIVSGAFIVPAMAVLFSVMNTNTKRSW